MKSHPVSYSGHNRFIYLNWRGKKYFFPRRRGWDGVDEEAARVCGSPTDPVSVIVFESRAVDDPALGVILRDKYFQSNCPKRDLAFSEPNFDASRDGHLEILIDVLFCIDENIGNRVSTIDKIRGTELSTLIVHEKPSSFLRTFGIASQGKRLFSLPLTSFDSYVATNQGLTFRTKSGELVDVSDYQAATEENYVNMLTSYSVDWYGAGS